MSIGDLGWIGLAFVVLMLAPAIEKAIAQAAHDAVFVNE